jgi:hypothetical protein
MKNKHIQTVAATVALLFSLAPLAHAEISVKGTGVIDTDVTHLEVKTTSVGEVHTQSEMKAEMHKEDDGQIKIETEGKSEMHMMENGEKMDGGMHATGTMRAMEMADEHALGALEKVQLHMDLHSGVHDEHGAGEPEMDMAVKVRTEHDFEDFVHHKAKSDEHLKGVEVKDGKIEVKYAEPAKLFGFMKTTLNVRASVDAKDNVEVEYPWYHIFMKKQVSKASLQSNIARAVAAERKGVMEGMATTTIEAKIEASMGIPNLFEIIANTLKEASLKAEVEAEAK